MKKILILMIFMINVGCATLSDSGAITQTKFVLPDGSENVIWERTKVNIWVPSTHMVKSFKCKGDNCVKSKNPTTLTQDGVGPALITEAVRSATVIGSTIYAADKVLEGAHAIGDGLAKSGDKVELSNGSNSISINDNPTINGNPYHMHRGGED